tara:strand:+ start:2589 stop:3749 length:1161 start_codon:yes stop_codon:yes gene_type:complete
MSETDSVVTSLDLSDEDFLNQPPPEDASVEQEASKDDIQESRHEDIIPEVSSEEDSEAQEQTDATTDDERVADTDGDTQQTDETSNDSDATESLDTSEVSSPDTKGDTPDTKEFDHKSAYEQITQPFKANGVDMQVKDPQDIVKLMQMGANYQKKMAQMKPNLMLIKMLEKNDLLDQGKLHNLIDLSKKNPDAIAKLLKDSGVDPLDIDTEGESKYRPTDYSVTDKEYELDAVLDEIKDTEHFSDTINVLTKEWDTASRNIISDNPNMIRVINDHKSNGVFDKVNTVLQQEKSLGNTKGISDIDAYRRIAEHLHQSGVLHYGDDKSGTSTESRSKDTVDKSQANAERNKQRKAVAPVKKAAPVKSSDGEGFLGLSDEEFMKKHAIR